MNCFVNSYLNIVVQRTKDLDTAELLEHLPALQQLLFRVLGCQVIHFTARNEWVYVMVLCSQTNLGLTACSIIKIMWKMTCTSVSTDRKKKKELEYSLSFC